MYIWNRRKKVIQLSKDKEGKRVLIYGLERCCGTKPNPCPSATIIQQRLEHHQSNAIDPAFHIKLFPGISADGAWENIRTWITKAVFVKSKSEMCTKLPYYMRCWREAGMCLSCLNQHNKFRTTNTTNWKCSLSLKSPALPPPSKHKRSNLGRYILFQQFSMQSSISAAAAATWGLEFCSKFLIRFMANQIFFTTWCKMSVMMISSKASLLPKKCQNFQTKFQAFNQFKSLTVCGYRHSCNREPSSE